MTPAGSVTALACPKLSSERYLLPTANIYPSKATLSRRASSDTQSQSDTNVSVGTGSNASRTPSVTNGYTETGTSKSGGKEDSKTGNERRVSAPPTDDLDVQSIINERRPSKLKSGSPTAVSNGSGNQCGSSIRAGSYGRVYVAEGKTDEALPTSAGSMSDSNGSTSGSGSGSGSGSASENGSRNGSAVVQIPEGICVTTASDVRIHVDDTTSTSSNGHRQRTPNDETPDASTTISSATALREGPDEAREAERPTSDGPSDPS